VLNWFVCSIALHALLISSRIDGEAKLDAERARYDSGSWLWRCLISFGGGCHGHELEAGPLPCWRTAPTPGTVPGRR